MKLKIRKPIYAFLILMPLAALFAFILFTILSNTLDRRVSLRTDQKLEAIEKTLNALESEIDYAYDRFYKQIENMIELMPILLEPYIEDGTYNGPEILFDADRMDGFVVQVKNGKVIYPGTEYSLPDLDAGLIMDEINFFKTGDSYDKQLANDLLLSSINISGDYFYIDMSSKNEIVETVRETTRMLETLREIEKSYDCDLLVINDISSDRQPLTDADQEHESADELIFLYRSEYFSDYQSPDEIGINREVLEGSPAQLTINGKSFQYAIQRCSFLGDDVNIVILTPLSNEYANIIISVILTVFLTLIAAVPMIMWLYWTQKYVRDHELLPNQYQLYHPDRLKGLAVSFALIGAVIVFLTTLCFQSLSNLNLETSENQKALQNLMDRLAEWDEEDSKYQANEEDWAAYFAERIALLISEKDSLQTPESLAKISELAGSDYIMIFDYQGEEVVSSNGFIGFSINNMEDLNDFQRVLSGLKSLMTGSVEDPILKKDIEYIGTQIPMIDENQKQAYGILMLAYDVEKTWKEADIRNIDDFLENTTLERNLAVVIDKNTNKVAFSSDQDFLEMTIPELRIAEKDSDDSDLDTFLIDGKRYYGPYQSNDSYICYYLTEETSIRISSFMFSVLSLIGYCIILFIISLYMLKPYSEEAFNEAARIKTESEFDIDGERLRYPDSEPDIFRLMEKRYRIKKKAFWDELTPEQKTENFIRIFLGIIVILLIFFQLRLRLYSERTTIGFVLTGNWKRGMNMLGWSAALIVVIGLTIFSFLKYMLKRIFCSVQDPKIETIFRLFFSLVQYIAFIFCVYLILGYLGFNFTIQLTSVGILSLAISLGSQSLIADILAGIFIIFEGDFHVGDIIEIDKFSGVVQEIGVRSTKLLGLGNTIKIINNSHIKNVLNLSKMNTWYTMEFNIASNQSLPEIESMLRRELPELKQSIPEIIAGPYYKGVWSIVTGPDGQPNYRLSIACECEAKKSRIVQRELNHAVIMLFDKYHFKLA